VPFPLHPLVISNVIIVALELELLLAGVELAAIELGVADEIAETEIDEAADEVSTTELFAKDDAGADELRFVAEDLEPPFPPPPQAVRPIVTREMSKTR
jgi:hypothetical protein